MPPAVCPADSQVLDWSSQVIDQSPNETFFSPSLFLFLILFPLHPPSLSFLPTFLFPPSLNTISPQNFLLSSTLASAAGYFGPCSQLTADSILLDIAEIIPLEDNAHFNYFFKAELDVFMSC